MTRFAVTPERLAALAGSLSGVADELAWCARRADADSWALGPGDSAAALAGVLGDFEHQRLLLQRSCSALADAVATAGSAYAQVDDAVAGAVDAVPDRSRAVTGTGGGGVAPQPGTQGAGGSW